jgi:hypothetical protein
MPFGTQIIKATEETPEKAVARVTKRKHAASGAADLNLRRLGTRRLLLTDADMPRIVVLLSSLSVGFGQGIAVRSLCAVDSYDFRVEIPVDLMAFIQTGII